MAFDLNEIIKAGHEFGKPYIIKGMQVEFAKLKEMAKKTGTIADDLLLGDLEESFQKPCQPCPEP